MERILLIASAAAFSTAFYYWFARAIQTKSMQDRVLAHPWLLHPNAICYWRTALALLAYVLYFLAGFEAIAIFIFTFAAVLDGVDGTVARVCNLVSDWGKWLDPLCAPAATRHGTPSA